MDVLLHDHIAAACERRVLGPDDGRIPGLIAAWILGPVDEPHDVAVVKVAEAVNLVGDGHCVAEGVHDLRRELEAEVRKLGADMKEKVARRRDGMAIGCADLPERVELSGPRRAEECVPGVRTDPRDAGESRLDVPELDSANQAGEAGEEGAQRRRVVAGVANTDDEKDRGARERTNDRLRQHDFGERVRGVQMPS